VHAKPGQTESQVDPSFQLASTWESFTLGFTICPYKNDIEKEVSVSELEKLTTTKAVCTGKKNVINAEK